MKHSLSILSTGKNLHWMENLPKKQWHIKISLLLCTLFLFLSCNDFVDNPAKLATPQSFLLSRPDTAVEGQTAVIVSWAPVLGATGYQIQQRQGSGAWADFTPSPALTGSSTRTTISALTADTSYSFRIRALKTGRDSDYSAALSLSTLAAGAIALSNTPANWKASAPKEIAKQSTGVELSWTALADNKVWGYEIQYHTKDNAWTEAAVKMKALADKGTASLSINDLTADTKFYFRIRAVALPSDLATAPGPWSASTAMIYPANKAELQTLINSRISATTPSPDLTDIYTGKITDMSDLFKGKASFNGKISSWTTANVTNMSYMFSGAKVFNGNIGNWDTRKVTDMSYMFGSVTLDTNFFGATAFNQDISKWNTAMVTNMEGMFRKAAAFNQDIDTTDDKWNTAMVTNMSYMFYEATAFNRDISNWNTAMVTNMESMFYDAKAFNQDINTTDDKWNTAEVTNMGYMFSSAEVFNGNIGNWDTHKVTDMSHMFGAGSAIFLGATAFNQDISGWNTANVTTMANMFFKATRFDQNLSNWIINKVTTHFNMFTSSAMASLTAKQPKFPTTP